jgi:hypothetical protein
VTAVCVLRVLLYGEGDKGIHGGGLGAGWMEGGGNHCSVVMWVMFFKITTHMGLLVSVKVSFMCCLCIVT